LVSFLFVVLLLTVPPCPAICISGGEHVPPVPHGFGATVWLHCELGNFWFDLKICYIMPVFEKPYATARKWKKTHVFVFKRAIMCKNTNVRFYRLSSRRVRSLIIKILRPYFLEIKIKLICLKFRNELEFL